MQTIHEIFPSVIKQSFNISYFDPIFQQTSKFFDLFATPNAPLNFEKILKHQKRDAVLTIVKQWITENSRPVVRTPILSASSFLLE